MTARYIASWCSAGWQENREPRYDESECKTLGAAKSLAARMANRYPEKWGDVKRQEWRGHDRGWQTAHEWRYEAGQWSALELSEY